MMKRPIRIVRNLGATVDDVVQQSASTPDPSEHTTQQSQQIAQATQQIAQQIVQTAQAANVPVAQLAQQAAQVAQQNQMVTAASPQAPVVYNSQDPNSPSEKSVSMMDYLIDNKWWVIIAVAVAYYAIKSED
jgi:ABC-type transporter Mla subunit MlaD